MQSSNKTDHQAASGLQCIGERGRAITEWLPYAGPKFGQNITDIILRFQVHEVALAANIEKAFLMVSMA